MSEIKELTEERARKAEMTLIAITHNRPRQERKRICAKLGIPWEEYQRLKKKYSRITDRYDKEKSNVL